MPNIGKILLSMHVTSSKAKLINEHIFLYSREQYSFKNEQNNLKSLVLQVIAILFI